MNEDYTQQDLDQIKEFRALEKRVLSKEREKKYYNRLSIIYTNPVYSRRTMETLAVNVLLELLYELGYHGIVDIVSEIRTGQKYKG